MLAKLGSVPESPAYEPPFAGGQTPAHYPPGYRPERRNQLLETILERLRVVPGVTHAAYGTALPFVSFGGFTNSR